MKRQNKLVLLILAIILIFSSVLTACKEEELSSEDKKERERVLEELREERNKIPEHVMVKEKYLDENDEIKGVVEYDYNDRGNITEANYYNDEGDLIERREYKYNDEGLLVERKITDLEGTWRDYLWRNSSKARIDFNNKWGVQEEILFELQEGLTATYEYNDNQQLIAYESTDAKGDKLRSIVIEYHPNYHKRSQKEKRFRGYIVESDYNKQGDLIKRFEEDDNYTRIEEYSYKENGKKVKKENVRKDSSGEIVEKTFSNERRDDKGRSVSGKIIGELYYGGGKSNMYSKSQYEYDNKGNMKKRITKKEGNKIDEIWEYEHDKKGNTILATQKDSEGNITSQNRHKREYDENGNMLRVITKTLSDTKTRNKEYYYKRLK